MGEFTWGIPQALAEWLGRASGAQTFVETGTNTGRTAKWASKRFKKVVTIEGFEPLFRQVSSDPARPGNVSYVFGDSRSVLSGVVRELKAPALFWLDAHWCGDNSYGDAAQCPILEEIESVNRHHGEEKQHVILIDDARLFMKPPPPPHRPEDWPDIEAVISALTSIPGGRYVFIYNDVIGAVPPALKAQTIEYLRTAPPPKPVGLPTRALARAKGLVGQTLGAERTARLKSLLRRIPAAR